MNWLSDRALERLRAAATLPDLSGTKYRAVRKIGQGGMGAVYEAEDTTLGRSVALKVLDVAEGRGELAERLLREARILARLEHPGIVPVHDVGTLADGRVFYTMKRVEGQRLDKFQGQLEALPERLRVFQRICEAVGFAHARGVLHRDLKPQNIMVGAFGEVLVMDWGVAKILREPEDTATAATQAASGRPVETGRTALAATAHGAVLGTPGYMPPEQARGETERVDERADVYALGALLRFLVTGQAPETATTLSGAGSDSSQREGRGQGTGLAGVPKPLGAIWVKAMAAEPAGRYGSAQELAADVARFMDGLAVTAYPEGIWRKAGRIFTRHRLAILIILAYLLTRGLILVFLGR